MTCRTLKLLSGTLFPRTLFSTRVLVLVLVLVLA